MTAVVVLGHERGDDELFRAIEAGAAAHVLDTVQPAELVRTVRKLVTDGDHDQRR